MKKLVIIFFIIFNFVLTGSNKEISIKSDDFYIEEICTFYFENLKELINNRELNSLEKPFCIDKQTLINMEEISKIIYSKNGYVKNIGYDYYIYSKVKNIYSIEVMVSYEVIIDGKMKNYNSVVNFGYSFFNGKDFKITFYKEELIEMKEINYNKIDKIIESYKNNNEEIIGKLEKEGVKTIIKYIPKDMELKKYTQILNDYAYFLSETDRYLESIPILERVINFLPDRAVAYLNLGDCYQKEYENTKIQIYKSKVIENYKQYVKLLKKDAKIPNRVKEILQ